MGVIMEKIMKRVIERMEGMNKMGGREREIN